jgi:DNA sulfur modification protein DndE
MGDDALKKTILDISMVLSLLVLSRGLHGGTKSLNDCLSNLPFPMPEMTEPTFPDHVENILDHGAVGDGRTLNTKAFAEAILACAKAGGGVVVVPPGTWLTGPIELESNVNLRVETGALVQFSKRLEDFPFIPGLDGKSKRFVITPPLHAFLKRNVAITGGGVFDGAGEVWRYVKKPDVTEKRWKEFVASGGVVTDDGRQWWPSREALDGRRRLAERNLTKSGYDQTREYLRPNLVQLEQCDGVLIDGPTFENSPKFHLVPSQCENVIIRNVKVLSPEYGQNTDGIDPRSCRNVVIAGCTVDVGDDGICLKPADIAETQTPGPSCQNIVVEDCVVYKAHGGFVIGSETYGGVRNVSVRNCLFIGTDVGLRFKSTRGRGGLVENVFFDGIRMRGIRTDAVLFDMYYSGASPEAEAAKDLTLRQAEPVTDRTPMFRNFHVKNIVCDGADRAVVINGLPEMAINNMVLENVSVSSKRGVFIADADGIRFDGCRIAPESGPVFTIIQSRNVTVKNGTYPASPGVFMKVMGEKSEDIRLIGSVFDVIRKSVVLSPEVKRDAIKIEK